VLGLCAGLLVAMVLVGVVVVFIADRHTKKSTPDQTSAARLVFATLKAKKRKVCPLIEVRP
jgi:hypothetical protein